MNLFFVTDNIKGKVAIPANLLKQKNDTTDGGLTPHPELAGEEISVIFVEHRDNMKIRKIFNKVNKYARQTGRGDNIDTSDDDIFAIISRRSFGEGEILEAVEDTELVNWKSNTLSERSKQLTTISALYTSAETILRDFGYSAKMRPSQDEIEGAFEIVREFWQELLEGLSTYKARQKDIPWTDVVFKLNKMDWSFDNLLWANLLITGTAKKKMITGKEYIRAAGLVISYMVMGLR